jgi:AcrR family transcriptional regulator
MALAPLDKGKVVAAACSLADSEGLDALTLTRVADELGVRQPALYRHVDGYDDLIGSLGISGREILANDLTEAAAGVSGDSAVRALGHAWRSMVRDHPGIYAATDRHPGSGDAELENAVERAVDIINPVPAGLQPRCRPSSTRCSFTAQRIPRVRSS